MNNAKKIFRPRIAQIFIFNKFIFFVAESGGYKEIRRKMAS